MGGKELIGATGYVDGYNLYRGLIDPKNVAPLSQYLWLDIHKLINTLISRNGYELARLKYFTAPVHDNQDRKERQDKFIAALETNPNFSKHLGNFRPADHSYREKKTDTLITLNIYSDAQIADCKSIVLLSGDTDQVPTLEWAKRVNPNVVIHTIFPPRRAQNELRQVSDFSYQIREGNLKLCQFPDTITREGLPTLTKPADWT